MRPPRPGSATAASSGSWMPISREVSARMRNSSVTSLRRVSERTRAIRAMSETGLVRKSSAPASSPRTRSDGWSSAVTITTGMWWVAGLALSRRHTSKPSMSGIITSSSTMSHCPRSQIASASAPPTAVTTSKYSAVSRASRSLAFAGTSSTTRTRAVIVLPSGVSQEMTDRLEEFSHRDRLRQVGLAAALADALLVALHGERGDGDHRDRLQVGIVLEPLGHFEAGYFRQLDVHHDQVRAVLAREVERLDAVARPERPVAVRLQQVVEELHVELVVFLDQDGLRHPCPSGCPGLAAAPTATVMPYPQARARAPPRILVAIYYGNANGWPCASASKSTAMRRNPWRFRRLRSWPRTRRDSGDSSR